MDSTGIANDRNSDGQSGEMQYLVPPAPLHIVMSTPEQSSMTTVNEEHQITRNESTGALQELQLHRQLSRVASGGSILTLSRRPSATVAAMQRPSVQRNILMEYVHSFDQSVSFDFKCFAFQFAEWTNVGRK